MSKFCHKCGSKLNDMDVFCEICGVKQAASTIRPAVEEPAVAHPTEEQPVTIEEQPVTVAQQSVATPQSQVTQNTSFVAKVKKMPKFLPFVIGGGVAAIVLIVVLAIVFSAAPYKGAVDDSFDFTFNGEYEKLEKLAPEEYWEYIEEINGSSVEDAIEYYELYDVYGAMIDGFEPDYGKNIKFSYKIVHEDELSERKLDAIKDGLKETYGIAKRTVKKAYELEIEIIISGSEDEDTMETEIIVVNIDNDWYITSATGTISLLWDY